MSVYTSVYALDSKIKAPEIGDNGCVGFPPVSSDGEQHDFLRIYKGLGQVGLTTRELDSFNAFIETHKGEHLYFDVEGEGNDPQRLNQILEEFERKKEEMPVFIQEGEENYIKAKYKISCGLNEYVSSHADCFLKTDSFSIDKGNLAALVEKVFEADDWEASFYRVWGLIDPYDGDLGKIRGFIINNPGPFTIEYLTGELAEKESIPAAPNDPAPAEDQTGSNETLKTIKVPDGRSTLVKIRDGLILLFFIWIGIRIIYHLYLYFS